jgi:plastocyanin
MSTHRLSAALVAVPFFVFAIAGCGSSDDDKSPADTGAAPTDTTPSDTSGDTASALTVTVAAGGSRFSPSTLNIKVGQTVTWVWAAGGHSVTSGDPTSCTKDGKFDSTVQATAGATFTHTFDSAGTFPYFCVPHCDVGMTGTIVVTP